MKRTFIPSSFTRFPPSGQYLFTASAGVNTTLATHGTGTLRLFPWIVTRATSIDRIGCEVTAAGDVGSKVRLGIYSDDGTGYPGALLLDAGVSPGIDGGSATVQDVTVSQTIAAGIYWIGGAVQTVTTTQPTLRVNSAWHAPVPIRLGTSAPASNLNASGFTQSSVTGALPSNFTATPSATGSCVRVHVRLAS